MSEADWLWVGLVWLVSICGCLIIPFYMHFDKVGERDGINLQDFIGNGKWSKKTWRSIARFAFIPLVNSILVLIFLFWLLCLLDDKLHTTD